MSSMKDVLNLHRDYNNHKMMFGEEMGLFDTVNRPYPVMWELFKTAVAQNWSEDEFDFSSCLKEFARKDDAADMMLDTLAWQWEADSMVSTALLPILAPFVSSTELAAILPFNTYIECLTPDHEVYNPTTKEWVNITKVRRGDTVMGYNTTDGVNVSQEVEGIVAKFHRGSVYHFTAKNFDQIVTPNHFMIVRNNGVETKVYAQDLKVGKDAEPEAMLYGWSHHVNAIIAVPLKDVAVEIKPYNGTVHCLQVPTRNFFVRRNNTESLSSNCIHSATYSEIVRNSFPNPKEVIEWIENKQEAEERVGIVARVLQELSEVGHKYALGMVTKEEAFPVVYLGVVALYLLERLQFIASFAITFALGEAGMYQPIAMAVRKIAADEIQIHATCDLLILRDMEKDELFKRLCDNPEYKQQVIDLVEEVIQGEMEWTEKLFKGRQLIGVTEQLIKEWVIYNAQTVKEELDIPVTRTVTENPIPWINGWLTTNKLQPAPQEQDIAAYKMGGIDEDTNGFEFDL